MKKAGVVAFGILTTLVGFASCGGKTEVTIELLDPCKSEGTSFRTTADYVEFAVFPEKCPADTTLAAGLTSTARYRKVVKASGALPDVGDLPKEKFGFAAILRDENCGVIGFGCTNADLDNTKKIIIAVRAWATPAGKNDPSAFCTPLTGGGCGPGLTCVSGNCKKVNDDDAGGCTLTVAAGGKLPNPVVDDARLSGPAITATDSGFVMAYRDQDTSSTTLRAVVYYVADNGTPSAPQAPFGLAGCVGKDPVDGVGLTYANGSGLITSSLPYCDASKGAGALFLPIDDKGVVSGAAGPQNPLFNDLTVGPVHSVGPAAADGEYEFIYRVVGTTPAIERVVLQGSGFKGSVPIAHPFGDVDIPFGLLATTAKVRAMLAPVGATTEIQVGARADDMLNTTGSFSLPAAPPWATLTAWGSRVAAAIPGSTGMTLKVAELTGSGEAGTITGNR